MSSPEFAPLPPGELLAGRRYEVVSLVSESPNLNAYLVRDRQQRYCPRCHSTASKAGDEFCNECGASFASEPVEHPGYLLRETLDQEMLARQALIAKLGLRHEGMVNIHQAFEYQPYGSRPRFYLLSDADEGVGLTTLPRPQAEEKVLTWGKQLAEALAYLHHNGVLHRRIRAENIRLVDAKAKLTNFNLADKPKGAPREWFAGEVEELARVLYDLLAGQKLSPAVAAIFDKALSPDKDKRYPAAEALAADLTAALQVLRRPVSATFLVGRRSDPGQVRELNEDSLLTLELEWVLQSVSEPTGLYAVADGMGGHSAGEVASALAIRTLGHAVWSKIMLPVAEEKAQAEPDYGALLKEACLEANRAVHERARQTRSDMGTTLVAALMIGSKAYIANVGDSRAYRVNPQEIRQITTDHSLVERLIATEQITREEARTHPQASVIYRTIGDKSQVEVDIFEQILGRDEWLVLCSDGLHGMVEDARIQQVLMTSLHPQGACEELVRLANLAGGVDNITVIVVQLQEVGRAEQRKEAAR
ncbi:MAG: Stp1/IreP family PP2C-type Ser/Thr phosphatase [Anaerolineae bacterium]|nr:Stp1/IreP family PP2C-type Ser/Thr phosphatase [Anaerolineae bacterium]